MCLKTDKTIFEAGEAAAYEAQVQVPNELLRCVGRLKFRTSFTERPAALG